MEKPILKSKVAIPIADGLEFIEVDSIIYCQSQSNYTNICTIDDRSFLISRTLKDVDRHLCKYSFIRVHQSYLINPNLIEKYCRNDGGYLIMFNGHKIPISNSKRSVIVDIFDNLRGE